MLVIVSWGVMTVVTLAPQLHNSDALLCFAAAYKVLSSSDCTSWPGFICLIMHAYIIFGRG